MASPHFRLLLPYGAPALRWTPLHAKGYFLRLVVESPCCGAATRKSKNGRRSRLFCARCQGPVEASPINILLERGEGARGDWEVDPQGVQHLERWLALYTDPLRAHMDSLVIADLVCETTALVESLYVKLTNDPRMRLDTRRELTLMVETLKEVEAQY